MARIAFLPHHIPLIKFRKKALLRCMLLSTLSDWGIVCVLVVGRWVFAWQIVAFYSRGSVEVCEVCRRNRRATEMATRLVLEDDVQGVDDAGDVCGRGLSVAGLKRNEVWTVKDLQPRTVNRMLMRRSAPQPRSRKTPRGGSTTAQMILMMSLLSR